MRVTYIFFVTDESFDFSDSPDGTCTVLKNHGFSIEIDKNNNILIDTLEGINDFRDVENCQSLEELYDYIEHNMRHVNETTEDEIEIKGRLVELQSLILENLCRKVA